MEERSTLWDKCVEFHGHVCIGLTIGFKAGEIALKELGASRSADEELVTIVENDACGVDAIQVLTGCTMGKGNLFYRNYGKQVYTFGNRKTGEAVRIAVKPHSLSQQELMELAPEEFCKVEKLQLEFPRKARIHKTISCAQCGEGVMEARLRVQNGQLLCRSCAGEAEAKG